MENNPTLEQIEATVRRVVQEELRKHQKSQSLFELWMNEKAVLELCGKSRWTLYKAIEDGKINPKDIRLNPIGKGYLFRRTAIIKD